MVPVTEQASSGAHILGNFPRFELVFVCAEQTEAADSVPDTEDPYARLVRLKELLDQGVITQEEFDLEKQKVLSQ
jgi:hypothetical protein